MNSLILRTASNLILPLLLIFSAVLLVRGHNVPGGGFVAGLVTASAFALHSMSYGPRATRDLLRIDLHYYIPIGLGIALLSGFPALLAGEPFMTGQWIDLDASAFGIEEAIKLGTPLVFDIGVYVTVVAVTLMMILTLEEAAP